MIRYRSGFCKREKASSSITEKERSDISDDTDQDFSHKEIKAY
jgi:hypothetical protein